MKTRDSFAIRLKELMKIFNVETWELADYLHIDERTIIDWKKGCYLPGCTVVCRVADYFDCSVDYLLGRSDVFKRS